MSSNQFDHLLRALAESPSRRATMRALGALALGRLAVSAQASAAERCDPCQKRRKGKCRGFQKDGAACRGNPTGFCVQGVCRLCAGPQTLCLDKVQCCSNVCSKATGADFGLCAPGAAGSLCRTNADCASNSCVQFVCQ